MKDRTSTDYERQSDASLIERFTEGRDERAFAEIVARHGTVVMAACRRRLSNEQDCLDAFQATFLTLVTKAKWIRQRSSVAGWLQRVAVRVSLDLRKKNSRRRIVAEPLDVEDDKSMDIETTLMIEEELARLPANYRNAIVLCHLEGHTGVEAARILSVPKNTLNSWLVRGRELLRKRLVKQGIGLSVGGLISACVSLNGSGTLNAALVQETSRAASLYAAGYPATSAAAATLAKATLSAMILTKLSSMAVVFLLTVGSLVGIQQSVSHAETLFTDRFSDGSITDGSPVTWEQYFGRGDVEFASNLEISNLKTPEINFRALTDPIADVSIRTTLNMQSGRGAGVAARQILTQTTPTGFAIKSVAAGFNAEGELGIWSNFNDDPLVIPTENFFLSTATGWDLANREVKIEFDVVGREVSLMVWPTDLDRPRSPQLIGHMPESVPDEGAVGFFFGANDSSDSASFKSFAIVPEPSHSTASIGWIALSAGLMLRRVQRKI